MCISLALFRELLVRNFSIRHGAQISQKNGHLGPFHDEKREKFLENSRAMLNQGLNFLRFVGGIA